MPGGGCSGIGLDGMAVVAAACSVPEMPCCFVAGRASLDATWVSEVTKVEGDCTVACGYVEKGVVRRLEGDCPNPVGPAGTDAGLGELPPSALVAPISDAALRGMKLFVKPFSALNADFINGSPPLLDACPGSRWTRLDSALKPKVGSSKVVVPAAGVSLPLGVLWPFGNG
jgi:hypothetical protein